MRVSIYTLVLISLFLPSSLQADEKKDFVSREDKIAKITDEQDELQADVQELVAEQTSEDVILLMEECQKAMNDAIGSLEDLDTGGKTIAAQTEVIEKIFQAAKKKSENKGNGTMDGMLEMMKGMMEADTPSGNNEENKKDGSANDTPGMGGEKNDVTTLPQTPQGTKDGEKKEPRRLPKSSGNAGAEYPKEFGPAMEAYNKSLKDQQEKTPPTETK